MRYLLVGLDCPNCALKIEKELQKTRGLEDVRVNFSTQSVDIPPELAYVAKEAVQRVEPEVKLQPAAHTGIRPPKVKALNKQINLIIVSAMLLLVGIIFNAKLHQTPYAWAEYFILLPAYLLVGFPVILQASKNLIRGALFDESFLMSVATIGAILVHQIPEAVTVMLFYAIGEYFQERAVNRSRRSIVELLNVQPEYANLKINGAIKQVNPEEVEIGQLIMVKPGERVPLDGTVVEGNSFMDTSALTGESTPRKIEKGDQVLAGMINGEGLLEIKTTKLFKESSIARILDLVEKASARKAPTEQFITVFAHYYTPVVVGAAVLLSVIPPLFIPGATITDWVYRALILLVISCPCALMVSIPLGYFGGVGGASRKGILVKGANYLDALANVKTVVFDKTGTLTKGVFKVTCIAPSQDFNEQEIIATAAAAELFSNHPIAQSIREACGKEISHDQVKDYREIPGHGISAKVNGRQVMVGNDRMLHKNEVSHQLCDIVGTNIHIVIDDKYAGYITISDEIKEDARETIEGLRKIGIENIVMLSGDEETVTRCVAENLGLDGYFAQLLPEDKVEKLEDLQRAISTRERGHIHAKHKLAFVGDGINDAPVITRADVGIAMGGLGSDAAIEAADIVLMEDHPGKLVSAMKIAQYTRKITYQNIMLALGVKMFFVILGTVGVATIWEAVFADVGVTLAAVFNAARTLNIKV